MLFLFTLPVGRERYENFYLLLLFGAIERDVGNSEKCHNNLCLYVPISQRASHYLHSMYMLLCVHEYDNIKSLVCLLFYCELAI